MTVGLPNCEVQGSTLALRGEFDIATLDDLQHALATLLTGSAAPEIVVDLTATTFVDCVTLGALMGADARARATGGRLILHGASPRIVRILKLFGAEPPFDIAR